MKRRSFVKAALVAVPAAQALGAQQPEARSAQTAPAAAGPPQAAPEAAPLEVAYADAAGEMVAPRFFSTAQSMRACEYLAEQLRSSSL